ncbi:potassium transporter TrkG [Mycoplasmopsis cricetuli]|uniref:potassium transporter TrkG n=1 Tax=Mycoplasmopsis cricetuli TaxID=171283 RepID=UPI00046F0CD7|nr:potassium transporter TrkG [Mycoplasmopsis cricetuli]
MFNLKNWWKRQWINRAFSRLINIISKFKKNLSKLKYLLFVYFLIVFTSTFLLWGNFSQLNINPLTGESNNPIKWVDALFTASSAFSDTGLTIKPTATQFNVVGQIIIAVLIFSGGIGVFALKLFVFNFLFRQKNTSMSGVSLIQSERGGDNHSKVTKIVISSVKFLCLMIIIFGFVLSIYFYLAEPSLIPGENTFSSPLSKIIDNKYINPKGNWSLSFKFGFFHTISAINNAGFDIMSTNSISQYYGDYFIQICFIVLFVIGGLGYPVLYDIRSLILHKYKRKSGSYHLTLFTKISLITYFVVFLFGFTSSLGFEIASRDFNTLWNKYNFPKEWTQNTTENFKIPEYQIWLDNNHDFENWQNWKDSSGKLLNIEQTTALNYIEKINQYKGKYYGNNFQKLFAILFISLSTRSAGFTTLNLKDFSYNTHIIYSIMMFIGAAPSSTGGGIRTTTFAIVLLGIISTFRGNKDIRIFKRAISRDNIFSAMQVFLISIILVTILIFICLSNLDVYKDKGIETDIINYKSRGFRIEHIFFEISSAFGTTGLSLGFSSHKNLTIISKISLIIIMFIGQFGISSLLFVWKRKKSYNRYYKYIEEEVAIG